MRSRRGLPPGQTALWAVGIITAVLTAFYVTRAMWMTFFGEQRDHHLYDHAHESPAVMTLPLILLAVGSAALGLLIGFPPESGFIHSFLEPAFEAAHLEDTTPRWPRSSRSRRCPSARASSASSSLAHVRPRAASIRPRSRAPAVGVPPPR